MWKKFVLGNWSRKKGFNLVSEAKMDKIDSLRKLISEKSSAIALKMVTQFQHKLPKSIYF